MHHDTKGAFNKEAICYLAKTNRTTMVTNKMNGFLKGIVA
jgi:hypothetical protein